MSRDSGERPAKDGRAGLRAKQGQRSEEAAPRHSSEAGKRSDERRAPALTHAILGARPSGGLRPSKFTPGELVKRSRDSAALQAGLDGNIVRAIKLEEIADKK